MRQYMDGLRVRRSRIYFGDTRWYVENASEHVVKGPFRFQISAEHELERLQRRMLEEEANTCPECGHPKESDAYWAPGCDCDRTAA